MSGTDQKQELSPDWEATTTLRQVCLQSTNISARGTRKVTQGSIYRPANWLAGWLPNSVGADVSSPYTVLSALLCPVSLRSSYNRYTY